LVLFLLVKKHSHTSDKDHILLCSGPVSAVE